jgi:diguanylate cyclase (GGDEF)-like protein
MEIQSHAASAQAAQGPDDEISRLRAQVTWLEAERAALWWAVGHDELTGLANRRLFNTLGPPLLRERGRRAVVIVLDLNGFKPINDQFGHAAGDDVLRIVAQRMASCAFDLAARLGGDEFAAILTEPYPEHHSGWWQARVATLAMAIAEPMPICGQALSVTASIGIAPADDEAPMAELLDRADQAMYQAKISRRSHISWEARSLDCDEPRVVELALYPMGHQPLPSAPVSPAPAAATAASGPPQPAPQPTRRVYRRGDPVWVLRYGAWRAGVVESASVMAIMATFRCEGRGTAVDTMSAEYVKPRADTDEDIDSIAPHPIAAA